MKHQNIVYNVGTAVEISSAVTRIYDYKILTISSNINADTDTSGVVRYILTLSYGKLELSAVFDLRLPVWRSPENKFLDALCPGFGKKFFLISTIFSNSYFN